MPDWYVAVTEPARDYHARIVLEKRGFPWFMPECIEYERWPGGTVSSRKGPLCPGYVFVQTDEARLAALAEVFFIADFVRNWGRPVRVGDEVIAHWRARVAAAGGILVFGEPPKRKRTWRPHEPVRVTGLPRELQALHLASAGAKIHLLLDMFNRQVYTTASEALVVSA